MDKSIELAWDGPYKLKWFLQNPKEKMQPGVYLWTLRDSTGSQSLFYVGKASGRPALGLRQQQHATNYLGLLYTIPAEFRSTGHEWIPGRYPDNAEDLLDLQQHADLVQDSISLINAIDVYLAPMLGDVELLKVVERNLLWQLQPSGTTIGTKTRPTNEIEFVHRNDAWRPV